MINMVSPGQSDPMVGDERDTSDSPACDDWWVESYRNAESWREAKTALASDGWSLLAIGDWSWVYASPVDWTVVRVCPFDPAFELFVEVARSLAANRHIVRVDHVETFSGGGFAVEMERLELVDLTSAIEFYTSFIADRPS